MGGEKEDIMPVCHICKENNLYNDIAVYSVKENIGTEQRPRHRICDSCASTWLKNGGEKLTIDRVYFAMGLQKK